MLSSLCCISGFFINTLVLNYEMSNVTNDARYERDILTMIDWCKIPMKTLLLSSRLWCNWGYYKHMRNFWWKHLQDIFKLFQRWLSKQDNQNLLRPYKSEPADLSAPWASNTPPVLHSPATPTFTFLILFLVLLWRRRGRGTEKENWFQPSFDVTALLVNLLFWCLAFSAVA